MESTSPGELISNRHAHKANDRHCCRRFASGSHSLALRFEHVAGPAEPLLWAPDVVCGAVNESRAGNSVYVSLLPALSTVLVDDR